MNERRWHLAGCMMVAAAGFVWAARAGSISCGAVRDVAGGDWAVEHDGAVLGADDADGGRGSGGGRGGDDYDNRRALGVSWGRT
jgi:hypothetical protein